MVRTKTYSYSRLKESILLILTLLMHYVLLLCHVTGNKLVFICSCQKILQD